MSVSSVQSGELLLIKQLSLLVVSAAEPRDQLGLRHPGEEAQLGDPQVVRLAGEGVARW